MARWVKTFVTSSNKEQNKYEAIVNYCERPQPLKINHIGCTDTPN